MVCFVLEQTRSFSREAGGREIGFGRPESSPPSREGEALVPESGSGRPCAARSDEGLRCFVMAVVSSLVFDVNVLIMKDFFSLKVSLTLGF